MTQVCLVSMPYAAIERPSIALGLLKASLTKNGIESTALYPNLWFAEEIGLAKYHTLSNSRPELLMGEWTFSQVAFPEFYPDDTKYLQTIAYNHSVMRQLLVWTRQRVAAFIEKVARQIIEINPVIVSCSSTFQQHCASLALLRRIRELNPEIITLMGGANCEGEMGITTQKSFPWLDFICSGEGDEVFASLCRQLIDKGRDITAKNLPYGAIATHLAPKLPQVAPRASVNNLDQIAIPDYDEYFQTLKQLSIAPYVLPGIPLETSRGCWWGQKQHCTFCGLNGTGITYRSKSPQRVVTEFTWLSQRHHIDKFFVVDNILDLGHIDTVLPILANLSQPYTIFYETKANLKRQQVKQLAQAGVKFIQPGIENLHDCALQLLKKGNSALMNVQLLKWAREYGLIVDWNFLIGIPEEAREWYAEMVQWLPQIFHLQPPSAAYPIRYDRFSPYHEQQEKYGLKLVPNRAYSYVYPLSSDELNHLAYYFENEAQNNNINRAADWRNTGLNTEHLALQKCIGQWGEIFWSKLPPQLIIKQDNGKEMTIIDTRPSAVSAKLTLKGLAYQIYSACDRVLTHSELRRTLHKQLQLHFTESEVKSALQYLQTQQILLELNGRLLSLALRAPVATLPHARDYPGGHLDIHNYVRDHRSSTSQSPQQNALEIFKQEAHI